MNKNRFRVILTTPSHSYPPWPTIMLIFRYWDETDLGDAHFCFLGLLRGVSILFYALCFFIFNICLLYCLALIKLCCHLKKKSWFCLRFFSSPCAFEHASCMLLGLETSEYDGLRLGQIIIQNLENYLGAIWLHEIELFMVNWALTEEHQSSEG